MELRLTDKEAKLLLEVFQEYQRHLLHEIAKSDHLEFRAALRARCETLEGILEKANAPVHAVV